MNSTWEEKLAEYRANRQNKTIIEVKSINNNANKDLSCASPVESIELINEIQLTKSSSRQPLLEPETCSNAPIKRLMTPREKKLWITKLIIKFILWAVLMALFVQLEFGAIFFILSLFYLIYVTLSSRPKKTGELSAYSVFNPNFEVLEGAFTAEKFDRQLRSGAVM